MSADEVESSDGDVDTDILEWWEEEGAGCGSFLLQWNTMQLSALKL